MEYKLGQIFFWRDTTSTFGKVIDAYNKKTFPEKANEWLPTHCGMFVGHKVEDIPYELIAEATDKGFLVDNNWYETWWLNVKLQQKTIAVGQVNEPMKNVYENAKKYEGIGYGWLDIIMIGISMLTGYKLGLTGKNKIICSEGVNYVVYDSTKTINFAAEYGLPPDQISPAHIYLSKQVTILK